MSTATTAPAAKAAILALIQTRLTGTEVAVTWGGPSENEDVSLEAIYFGRTTGTGDWRTLGGAYRHESYLIELRVAVTAWSDDEQATEERAYALLDECSGALASDRFLGGLLFEPAAIESWEHTNIPMTKQWGSMVAAQVRCNAQFQYGP